MKWSEACKPKSKGGLGVRDIRLVNLALLVKCMWRLILDISGFWCDILAVRYGDSPISSLSGDKSSGLHPVFPWWKEMSLLG